MKQIKDNGWEKEDIESFEVCIKKGDFVIKF